MVRCSLWLLVGCCVREKGSGTGYCAIKLLDSMIPFWREISDNWNVCAGCSSVVSTLVVEAREMGLVWLLATEPIVSDRPLTVRPFIVTLLAKAQWLEWVASSMLRQDISASGHTYHESTNMERRLAHRAKPRILQALMLL